MKVDELFEKVLDKLTMNAEQLANHHGVDIEYIKAQIEVGMKHELEHTSNEDAAREIARDHLKEDPKYYEKLKQVEN